MTYPQNVKPTRWWYLASIIFSWIGGIIMYFAVKNEGRRMANKGMILGLIMTLVDIMAYFILIGVMMSAAQSRWYY